MKPTLILARTISTLSIAALAAGITGCSTTTSYQRGDAAARSFQDAAAEVQVQSRELKLTMTALDSLIEKPATDLKPQYKEFTRCLSHLETATARNERAAAALMAKNSEYLTSWDQQITNMNYEVVKNRSEARRTEVADRYDKVSQRYNEVRTVMRPMLAYLNDIRLALGADLTSSGLESVKPIVTNAGENAGKVQTALAKLSTELNDSGMRLSSYFRATPQTSMVSVADR